MKRCPECNFIYEEEQAFCDMDGARLLHDTHALPLAPAMQNQVARPAWKTRLLVALPIIVLVLLGVFAFRSSNNKTRVEPSAAAAQTISPASETPQSSEASTDSQKQASAERKTGRRSTGNDSDQANSTSRTSRRAASNSTPRNQGATASRREKKEDSKIGSIFSKTKRIIKKPFKF
jgi:hypothetical protein